MLKRLITVIIALMSLTAAPAQETLFPYPSAPETLGTLQERCDWLVLRFWDRCNFDTAFRNRDKLHKSFGDWISIMQHSSLDSATVAIDRLIHRFEKKGPETVALADIAEAWLYSDTTETFQEELYLPFAVAASNAKKVPSAEKARFAMHRQVIESSAVGRTVPELAFEKRDGGTFRLSEIEGKSILLFFNDPDCGDCRLAKVRLGADYNTNALIDRGEMAIVSIYAGEPDDAWRQAMSTVPDSWIVVALPDADLYFDLSESPAFFYLNSAQKVLAKHLDLEYLLNAFRAANMATQNRN